MLMVETRRADRVRSFLRARILFNNGASTIDCVIKNISQTGAKIDIVSTMSVPSEFDLEVPQRGRTYRCRMVWRTAESIGVTFADDTAVEDNSEIKMRALESENRKLRATVAKLTKRLEDLGQVINFS